MRRFAAAVLALLAAGAHAGPITLTILHTDDLHGHVEPVQVKNGWYGGYAKQATLIKRFRASDPNPLVLSGGDTFQGTMYFRVYSGLADCFFMNYMGYQGMAVGNHEFDLGPAALADFAKQANFPLLAANLDVSAEPRLSGLIKPTSVLTVGKERVGLVGAVTPDLPSISAPGDRVKMLELFGSLENAVESLRRQGIDKIVLLSHLGYALEKEVAAKIRGIDVIVGGHSHTLLGTFDNADFPKSSGPYPTVVKNADGNRTLLLAAWEWGKVLGRIKVSFDGKGAVKGWSDAQPIVVDSSIPDDPVARSALAAYQKPIMAAQTEIVATIRERLDPAGSYQRETGIGNVLADSMIDATKDAGARIGLMNPGGIRSAIEAGPLTYSKASEVAPFQNRLVLLDLTGEELKRTLELSVDPLDRGRVLQVSRGFHVVYDLSKPGGSRVVAMDLDGKPIDEKGTYRIVTNSFLAGGGDGFLPLKESTGRRVDTGIVDLDALIAYLKRHGSEPVRVEGRIEIRRSSERASIGSPGRSGAGRWQPRSRHR